MSLRVLLLLSLTAALQASAPQTPLEDSRHDLVRLSDGGLCAPDHVIVQMSPLVQADRSTGAVALEQVPEFQQLRSVMVTGMRPLIARDEVDELSRDTGTDRYYLLETEPTSDVESLLSELSALSSVVDAWPDYRRYIARTPTDSYYSQQWAHHNTGQARSYSGSYVGTTDCDIDTDQAWDITTGSTDVIIAILDTGIDSNHPDLQAKLVSGYDFANGDSNPEDDEGHGTACAGIAAAISNNSTGVAGVDWNARLMPVKVLDSSGSGWDSDIISGITWARTHGADVISMSLGADGSSSSYTSPLSACWSAGVMVVAAAGNDNDANVDSPANNTYALAIGALSPCNERKNPSSCDGEYWWGSSYGTGLEVMAPGTRLHTTQMGGGYMSNMNGTSGATPHVAGVIGLIKSVAPTMTSTEIRQLLRDTADDLSTTGWDSQTGYGRVNAYQAVLAVGDPCDSDVTGPTLTHTPLGNTSNNTTPYLVQALATDDCDISSVTLYYQTSVNPSWVSAAMSLVGGYYTSSIPAQSYGTVVNYYISAIDDSPQNNESTVSGYFYVIDPCASDYDGPLVGHTPPADTYQQDGIYTLIFAAADPCGISSTWCTYSFNGGAPVSVPTYPSGNDYLVAIPGTGEPGVVSYTFTAQDASPNYNTTAANGAFQVLDPCQIDTEAPVITHTPPADTSEEAPYALSFEFVDPCGIGNVYGEYHVDGGAMQVLLLVDQGDGTWLAEIPYSGIGLYEYHIMVEDASPQHNLAEAAYSFNVLDPCADDTEAPTITHTALEDTYDEGPYALVFEFADPCDISLVTAGYEFDGGTTVTLTLTDQGDGSWTGDIPDEGIGDYVYHVSVYDGSPQTNLAEASYSFEVLDSCNLDVTPPSLSHTPQDDTYLHGPYELSFSVDDPCGISAAELEWRLGSGEWQSATLSAVSGGYEAELPYQGDGVVSYAASFADDSPQQNTVEEQWSFEILSPTVPDLFITLLDPDTVQLDWTAHADADSYSVWSAGADDQWTLQSEGLTQTSVQYSVGTDTVLKFRVTAEFNH